MFSFARHYLNLGGKKVKSLRHPVNIFLYIKRDSRDSHNSTSLQHFLGLCSHPPLCQHFMTNYWLLKWTKFVTFLLQFIFFVSFSKQGPLNTAGCELPPTGPARVPLGTRSLLPKLIRNPPLEIRTLILWLMTSHQIPQIFPFLTLESKSCLLGNTHYFF